MKRYELDALQGYPLTLDDIENSDLNDGQIEKAMSLLLQQDFANKVRISGLKTSPNGANTDVLEGLVIYNDRLHYVPAVTLSGSQTENDIYLLPDVTTESILWGDAQARPTITSYQMQATTNASGAVALTSFKSITEFLRPRVNDQGQLLGLPKSDSVTDSNSEKLATSAAVKALNDTVQGIKSRTDKMGNAYFKFTSTGSSQYQSPQIVPWDVKKGNITGSGAADVLLQPGLTYKVQVIQGDDGTTKNFEMAIDTNPINLQDGRNVYTNNSGNIETLTFRDSDNASVLEVEVSVLG